MVSIAFHRPVTAFVLGLTLVAPLRGEEPPVRIPPPGQKWFAAESPNFQYVTDCSERNTRDLAKGFEVFRQVLTQITPGLRTGRYSLQSAVPTYVYLFDNTKDFDAFAGSKGWSGFFHATAHGNFVAVAAGRPQARQIVYHEYMHYFVRNNFPNTPSWVNEGLAEFYSTIQVIGQEAVLGKPLEGHLYTLKHQPPIPMGRLTSQVMNLHDESNEEVRAHYYASAWLAVHYLLAGNDARRSQLGIYLEMLRAGIPGAEAFRRAFKCEPAALDQEMLVYRSQVLNRYQTLIVGLGSLAASERFTFGPLPRAEALGRLSMLAGDGGRTEALAMALCSASLAEDPANGAAHYGRALLAYNHHRWVEAATELEAVVLARPKDVSAHWLAGVAYLQSAGPGTGKDQANHLRAREHLVRCLELDPGQSEALNMALGLCLMDPEGSQGALPILEKAVAQMPARLDLQLRWADLLDRTGAEERSRALLATLASQGARADIAEQARLRLAALADRAAQKRFQDGVAAIQAGREAEGRQLVREAIEQADSQVLKDQYETYLGQHTRKADLTLTGGAKGKAKKGRS
jgi:tetratricopeptide (TPR) repeat protein